MSKEKDIIMSICRDEASSERRIDLIQKEIEEFDFSEDILREAEVVLEATPS